VANKIDSNLTGLSICEEASLKTLLGTSGDVWYPYEPNSYSCLLYTPDAADELLCLDLRRRRNKK